MDLKSGGSDLNYKPANYLKLLVPKQRLWYTENVVFKPDYSDYNFA